MVDIYRTQSLIQISHYRSIGVAGFKKKMVKVDMLISIVIHTNDSQYA